MLEKTVQTMALGFLDLPAEIRNQIYHLALVREASEKIELWPDLYSEDEYGRGLYTLPIPRRTVSEEQAVLAWYYPGLLYVRKELAVGILATCRQVHDEAAGLFWSGNHFSFSGYLGWYGLLRFLSTIGEDAKAHMRCLSVEAPFFSWNGQYSEQFFKTKLDELNTYATGMRLAEVYPEPSECGLVPIGRKMLKKFHQINALHLVVPRGRRMQYTAAAEESCRRLRLMKITLSLEIAGTLYTEWGSLENLIRSDALTLTSGSIIRTLYSIPFPHQHLAMHIRRGGTLIATGGAVGGLNVYRHLVKVDEVIKPGPQFRDREDIYDSGFEDIYDVI